MQNSFKKNSNLNQEELHGEEVAMSVEEAQRNLMHQGGAKRKARKMTATLDMEEAPKRRSKRRSSKKGSKKASSKKRRSRKGSKQSRVSELVVMDGGKRKSKSGSKKKSSKRRSSQKRTLHPSLAENIRVNKIISDKVGYSISPALITYVARKFGDSAKASVKDPKDFKAINKKKLELFEDYLAKNSKSKIVSEIEKIGNDLKAARKKNSKK